MINVKKIRKEIPELLRTNLSDKLTYHSANHTIDVAHTILDIAYHEGIRDQASLELLETAAWLHDTGFLKTYHNHEQESCKIAGTILQSAGANTHEIETIQSLILATKLPQTPYDRLSSIICDADLDYIGRPEFHDIAKGLHQEWLAYGFLKNEDDFDEIQIKFLTSHHFFTAYNQKHREPLKQQHLKQLIESRK